MEAKQETCDQEIKAIQAKYNAVSKEMDKMNATFGELDVSLQKTTEKQNINFMDIMKEQMEQEMMNVGNCQKGSECITGKSNCQHSTSADRHSRK